MHLRLRRLRFQTRFHPSTYLLAFYQRDRSLIAGVGGGGDHQPTPNAVPGRCRDPIDRQSKRWRARNVVKRLGGGAPAVTNSQWKSSSDTLFSCTTAVPHPLWCFPKTNIQKCKYASHYLSLTVNDKILAVYVNPSKHQNSSAEMENLVTHFFANHVINARNSHSDYIVTFLPVACFNHRVAELKSMMSCCFYF